MQTIKTITKKDIEGSVPKTIVDSTLRWLITSLHTNIYSILCSEEKGPLRPHEVHKRLDEQQILGARHVGQARGIKDPEGKGVAVVESMLIDMVNANLVYTCGVNGDPKSKGYFVNGPESEYPVRFNLCPEVDTPVPDVNTTLSFGYFNLASQATTEADAASVVAMLMIKEAQDKLESPIFKDMFSSRKIKNILINLEALNILIRDKCLVFAFNDGVKPPTAKVVSITGTIHAGLARFALKFFR